MALSLISFRDVESRSIYLNNSIFSISPANAQTHVNEHLSRWQVAICNIDILANHFSRAPLISGSRSITHMRDLRFKVKKVFHDAKLKIQELQEVQKRINDCEKSAIGHDSQLNKIRILWKFQKYRKLNWLKIHQENIVLFVNPVLPFVIKGVNWLKFPRQEVIYLKDVPHFVTMIPAVHVLLNEGRLVYMQHIIMAGIYCE
jgi:hypothetical protein